VSTKQFANERSVSIKVGGRYSLANWYDAQGNRREFACRTTQMSPFRMLIDVPVVGKVGERVVSYFSDFGNLDGWITDTTKGSFLVDLEADKALRSKLARKLAWLEKHQSDPSVVDARSSARIIPKAPHSTIIFADGTYSTCFIIDMSITGAAVSADARPEIGMPLAVGSCVGRVVRCFREGFAVQFVEPQDPKQLETLVARPPRQVSLLKLRSDVAVSAELVVLPV
jgi:hypothetical protein